MKLLPRARILFALGTLALAAGALTLAEPARAAKKPVAKSKKPAAETPAPEAAAEPPAPAPVPVSTTLPDDMPDADTACKAELQSHCLGTIPGGLRVVKCLRDNKSKNSQGCNKAMYDYLKRRFLDACGADVKRLCQAEQHKQGALMPCMQSHADALAEKCKDELGLGKPAAPPPGK